MSIYNFNKQSMGGLQQDGEWFAVRKLR